MIFVLVMFVTIKLTGNLLVGTLAPTIIATSALAMLIFLLPKFEFVGLGHSYFLLLFALICLMIVSLTWSTAPNYGFFKIKNLISFIVLGLISGAVWIKYYKNYIKVFSLIFILVLAYLLIFQMDQFKKMILESVGGPGRFNFSKDTNSNVVSVYFGTGIICLLSYFEFKYNIFNDFFRWSKQTLRNLSVGIITIFGAFFLFFTGSRGAMVSLIGAFILYNLFAFLNIKKFFLIVILVLIGYISFTFLDIEFIIMSITPDEYKLFVNSRFFAEDSGDSLNARFDNIKLALTSFNYSNPFELLFGNGIGGFGFTLTGTDARSYPHNIFIEVFYEMGLVGLTLFSTCITHIIINIKKLKGKYNKYLFIHFLFYFLLPQSSGDLQTNFLLFIYMILCMKSIAQYNSNISNNS